MVEKDEESLDQVKTSLIKKPNSVIVELKNISTQKKERKQHINMLNIFVKNGTVTHLFKKELVEEEKSTKYGQQSTKGVEKNSL